MCDKLSEMQIYSKKTRYRGSKSSLRAKIIQSGCEAGVHESAEPPRSARTWMPGRALARTTHLQLLFMYAIGVSGPRA